LHLNCTGWVLYGNRAANKPAAQSHESN
jgi:hypothetical protein